MGTDFLRLVENPAHDEWNIRNLSDQPLQIKRILKQFIEDYKAFVVRSLNDFFKLSDGAVLSIRGLDQYLYIPTDVDLEEDDEDAMEAFSAEPTGDIKDDGTSITTIPASFTINPITNGTNQVGKVVIRTQDRAKKDKDGELYSGKSDHPRQRPGSGMGTKANERNKISKEGTEGTYLSEIPVTYRCFAQVESGIVYHNIVIHSEYEVEKGQLHIVVMGDDSTDIVKINYSNIGKPQNNTVVELPISIGKNEVKIRFADNLKHSIKLIAYENK